MHRVTRLNSFSITITIRDIIRLLKPKGYPGDLWVTPRDLSATPGILGLPQGCKGYPKGHRKGGI